jgi:hypothetical protein
MLMVCECVGTKSHALLLLMCPTSITPPRQWTIHLGKMTAATPPHALQQADRRPPRPGRKSHVHIIRARRFEAFVTGFCGFATPPR